MRKKFIAALVAVAALSPFEATHLAAFADASAKLDLKLKGRTHQHMGRSRVIVRPADGVPLQAIAPLIRSLGGQPGRQLSKAGHVALVSNRVLRLLADSPFVGRVSLDREIVGVVDRTSAAVGAALARQQFGYDGSGVGVAIIDSGITPWHDDLGDAGTGQRVVEFVDFAGGSTAPRDDYGHGTHVAGIIAGNGFDSSGGRTGLAPGSHIVSLKVLDANGRGYVSDVIAAIDHAIARSQALNIKVINLSVATGVYESYHTDPLTLAAERAVRAGITVVAAAGNNGRTAGGLTQYGAIAAPGNAPWVLTVGASSHMGTVDRTDDTVARFTSRGPTAIDRLAKPDLVAPGVGIESLSDASSRLYAAFPTSRLGGTLPQPEFPYLSLTGTSMAAPVVSGTVALMLQANPALTPNQVKAILQYTAEVKTAYDPLTEGAGFVNARGAIELARHLASPSSVAYPGTSGWSRSLIWGNSLVTGGRLTAWANAWSTSVTWGAVTTPGGQTVSWGLRCTNQDCSSTSGPWRPGQSGSRNVVWGSLCSGADCTSPWSIEAVSATEDGETVVWGTDDGETVVWGTTEGETVVWGTEEGETVVWGTGEGETVVWGTSCRDLSCSPLPWSRR
jgi:serine protease AprX